MKKSTSYKKRYYLFNIFIFLLFPSIAFTQAADPIKYVNPFIGTAGGGNTFPGAALPFGVVSVSPDVTPPQGTSGYKPGKPVIGFSHVHTSGTGGAGRYGNFPVFPQNGEYDSSKEEAMIIREKASPAYYTAELENGVTAEMTLTKHVGFHKYIFLENTASIKIDISNGRQSANRTKNDRGYYRCNFAEVLKISNTRIMGFMDAQGGWGGINPHRTYFVAEFNRPVKSFKVTGNTRQMGTDYYLTSGDTDLSAFCHFNLDENKEVTIKVAISYKSYENAEHFLNEISDWDFEQVKAEGEGIWRKFLNKIQVNAGTEKDLTVLYTGLYHSAIMPRDLTGDNPLWESNQPHFWDYYCLWDTYRSQNPLLALVAPEMQGRIIAGLLDIYKHRGWLPDAWTGGNYGVSQGGSNADIVISEAIQKEIGGFDYELAFEAMVKNAETPNLQSLKKESPYGRAVNQYNKNRYLPSTTISGSDVPGCPVSRSLEYAYNDFAIALAAKKMGKTDDYWKYLKRSDWAFNLFNPETKFFWAKDQDGNWLDGFDPDLHNKPWRGPYYEGTPWHYSMSAPHNVEKLIELHGGNDRFVAFLDTIFERGHYTQNNQPDIHMPWLYHYAGKPEKSNERVHRILSTEYGTGRNGLPGNDDAGTMSAWAVLASIGLYPVPGQDIYLLTTPVFENIEIDIGEGNKLKIVVKNSKNESRFIRKVILNDKKIERYWLKHDEIKTGGKLELILGEEAVKEHAVNVPPSYDKL